jgi:hypothetical protein
MTLLGRLGLFCVTSNTIVPQPFHNFIISPLDTHRPRDATLVSFVTPFQCCLVDFTLRYASPTRECSGHGLPSELRVVVQSFMVPHLLVLASVLL